MRSHVAHDCAFDRADIGNRRAARQMRADLGGDLAAGADRHADDDEVGAGDGGGIAFYDLIGEAELGDAPARAAERAVATISRTAPCARAARAIDEPIRPTPINARRLNTAVRAESSQRHAGLARNSLSAATTSRLASSVPTLMRSAFGSL